MSERISKAVIKAEIHQRLFDGQRGTKMICNALVDEFLDLIGDEVMDAGNEVHLLRFGTFKPQEKSRREGRIPSTGEPAVIHARTRLSFAATDDLRHRLSSRVFASRQGG